MKTSPRPRPRPVRALGAAPRRAALAIASLTAVLALTSCTSPGGSGGGTTPGTTPAASPSETAAPPSALAEALGAPSDEVRQAAEQAVADMDTAEQAGQVLVGQLGAAGTDPDSIRELNLGGVIVMGDAVPVNADGTHDVQALAVRLGETQEALTDGRDWSGVVSVDQEGGLVARVKEPLTEWPTPMSYGAITDSGTSLARAGHAGMGRELAELGFTVDFAPSVDVTVGAEDPVIGARAFSSDPERVTELGRAATVGLLGAGVLPAPKHFPGHGSVTEDSHVTAPIQAASLAELEDADWLPFADLINTSQRFEGNPEGADAGTPYTPMVMMGHIIVPELEEDVPASVSAPAYEALRGLGASEGTEDSEGYDGVVVTDALNMGALVERYGADEAPVRALAAGADLLLMPSDLTGARDAIVAAVDSGEVPAERLTEAAERVVTMLLWRDALATELDAATDEEKEAAGVGQSTEEGAEAEPAEEVSRAVSAAAVTVVEGECAAPLVEESVQVTGGTEQDRARFAQAAESAGLSVGSGPVVRLLGGARETGTGDVVVALDAPFGLAGSSVPDGGALLALYGRSPGAFDALMDVLTGEAAAPGALPVGVGEWPAGTGC